MHRHSVTSLENARSLANDPKSGGLRWNSPGIAASPIFFGYGSTGGVCGRSLTAGKILFTGRQTCYLYLVYYDSAVAIALPRCMRSDASVLRHGLEARGGTSPYRVLPEATLSLWDSTLISKDRLK